MMKEYIRYLKDNPEGYWFKARLYGWGWTPAKKEGWLVLLLYLLIIIFLTEILAEKYIDSDKEFLIYFLPLITIATTLLIWICYKKGEQPRWMCGVPNKYKTKK